MRNLPIALALVAALAAGAEETPYVRPQDPEVLRKLDWWQDQKFGLMLHWGPYSQWGVVESWSICPEDETWCERKGPFAGNYFAYKTAYEHLGTTFDPGPFDPSVWARAAKAAGMTYVVFTTKHHDGFCMFRTATTPYGVMGAQSPCRRDLAREVFSAFRREGLGIGAYFSKPDWHSENYWWPRFPPKDRHANYDPAKYPERWKGFVDFLHRQVEELMTGYGPIDILWLDGGWVAPPREDVDIPGLAAMARRHQPGLLVVDRAVGGPFENYRTPEQTVPDRPLDHPWETCMTMGTSWSYLPGDTYKDARTLIHLLCRIVSRGGNFLLNVGPGPKGELDPVALDRLQEMGAWMKVNEEAIRGTRPQAPFATGDVVFTGKAGVTYALALSREPGAGLPATLSLPAEAVRKCARVELLGFKGALTTRPLPGGGLEIQVPEAARKRPPCRHAWAFRLCPKA